MEQKKKNFLLQEACQARYQNRSLKNISRMKIYLGKEQEMRIAKEVKARVIPMKFKMEILDTKSDENGKYNEKGCGNKGKAQ